MSAGKRRSPRRAAWALYVLQCADGSLYVGTTTSLRRRLAEHRAGKGAAYTRGRRPVALCYQETHPDRSSAQRREAEIKGWPRHRKLALLSAEKASGWLKARG